MQRASTFIRHHKNFQVWTLILQMLMPKMAPANHNHTSYTDQIDAIFTVITDPTSNQQA